MEIRIDLASRTKLTGTLVLTLGRIKTSPGDDDVKLRFEPEDGDAVELGMCNPYRLRDALRGLGFNV